MQLKDSVELAHGYTSSDYDDLPEEDVSLSSHAPFDFTNSKPVTPRTKKHARMKMLAQIR